MSPHADQMTVFPMSTRGLKWSAPVYDFLFPVSGDIPEGLILISKHSMFFWLQMLREIRIRIS